MQKRNSDKLQYAMRSLEEAIKYCQSSEFQGLGIEFKSVLISAVAQNFHLTFAVCRQMISRQLADRLGSVAIENKTMEDMLRLAANEKILTPLNRWLDYLDCHLSGTSSHGALRAFEKASAFLEDARELLFTCAVRTQNERRLVA